MRTINKSILNKLEKQTIVILGFSRTGLSTYHFLRKHLPTKKLAIADKRSLDKMDPKIQQVIKKDQYLTTAFGKNYLAQINDYQLIFKSPGIPSSLPQIQKALHKGSSLSSNTAIFMQIINEWPDRENKPVIIGVTGTKGKSTTTTLIYEMFKRAKHDAILVGNIGIPPLSQIDQIKSKTKVIMELSSHQLAELKISPDIAVIQEITSEHLDYYTSIKEYVEAKSSIARYQKVDQYIIYNPLFKQTNEIANLSKAKHLHYSLKATNDSICYINNDCLIYRDNKQNPEEIVKINDIKLRGKHNLYNIIPSVIIAKLFNIKTSIIANTLKKFQHLAHRLELVRQINDITFINDSLATTVEATINALQTYKQNNIILLAGGFDRKQDFSSLADQILVQNIKSLILFPTTGERLLEAIKENNKEKKQIDSQFVNSMEEAFKHIKKAAKPGDIVLLSPAAASFGLFRDYADRGNQFKKLVQNFN